MLKGSIFICLSIGLYICRASNGIKETLNTHSTPLNNEPVPQVLKQVVNLSCYFTVYKKLFHFFCLTVSCLFRLKVQLKSWFNFFFSNFNHVCWAGKMFSSFHHWNQIRVDLTLHQYIHKRLNCTGILKLACILYLMNSCVLLFTLIENINNRFIKRIKIPVQTFICFKPR